ncbi:MAG: MarR family winged helix-turn-helix transcriptional regulator [Bosea sp. (in: a-proteobacteria)]|uniref:MarR family winged helix-turn-helix transcriptional regulator n=1 Tax=Bosea sp. (in: a-proteobacteria) TaxID=1871050 RepID=UPI0027326107|nr:MarR family winged helix-turn-helix transcriptional regulator [Bosea sp. (in: a-proteobacteria)]MDP3600470.1 MarR family winged helix-turn-helix transcriptional regulator [Bosea sp. (in: a-proteobacteria)]
MVNKKQEVADVGTAGPPRPWDLPRFRNWIAVARVHQLWKKVFGEALAPLGIQVAHYDVLANIAHVPGLTQQALAEKLLVGRSAMSMLLPELERRGLIERRADEADRRLRRLWLTPEGQALTDRAMAIHVERLEAMMTVLSDAECDAVGEMMRRIAASMTR